MVPVSNYRAITLLHDIVPVNVIAANVRDDANVSLSCLSDIADVLALSTNKSLTFAIVYMFGAVISPKN